MATNHQYNREKKIIKAALSARVECANEDIINAIDEAYARWYEFCFRGGGEGYSDKRRIGWLITTAYNFIIDGLRKGNPEIPISTIKSNDYEEEPDDSDLFTIFEDHKSEAALNEKWNMILERLIEFILDNIEMNETESIIFERNCCGGEKLKHIAEDLNMKPDTLVHVHVRLLNKIKKYFIKINIKSLSFFDQNYV